MVHAYTYSLGSCSNSFGKCDVPSGPSWKWDNASEGAYPANKLDLIWFNQLELLAYSQPFTLKTKKNKKQLLTFNYTVSGFERLLRGSVPFTASNTRSSLIIPDTAQHTVYNNAGFTPLNEWMGLWCRPWRVTLTAHTKLLKVQSVKPLLSSNLTTNTRAHFYCIYIWQLSEAPSPFWAGHLLQKKKKRHAAAGNLYVSCNCPQLK